jgi:hypothetical protein
MSLKPEPSLRVNRVQWIRPEQEPRDQPQREEEQDHESHQERGLAPASGIGRARSNRNDEQYEQQKQNETIYHHPQNMVIAVHCLPWNEDINAAGEAEAERPATGILKGYLLMSRHGAAVHPWG